VPPLYCLPPAIPRTRGKLHAAFGAFAYRRLGWRFEGAVPDVPKLVAIVAPHTSNLDFFIGLFAKWALRLEVKFLGKHTLFKPPLGWFMRAIGGIAIRRDASHNVVDQMIDEFAARDKLVLVIAPEGTRKKVTQWKSGFYHIARGARVPILCIAFDWGRKVIRFGPTIEPSGDVEAELPVIRGYFADVKGRRPHLGG
jgi:1-acyl-sn-glycerol-3-phosphate acyltransferase